MATLSQSALSGPFHYYPGLNDIGLLSFLTINHGRYGYGVRFWVAGRVYGIVVRCMILWYGTWYCGTVSCGTVYCIMVQCILSWYGIAVPLYGVWYRGAVDSVVNR